MRRAPCLLAVAALALASWPCGADEILLATDPELRGPLARALGDAELTLAPEVPGEAPPRTAELLAEAARAYSTMDSERALALVADARTELDRTGGGSDGPGTAVRAELLAALALSAAGRPDEVDGALGRALCIAPDLTVDPVEYPPWLRERAATLAQAPAPSVTLELRGAPGAESWIDGSPGCVLPCARDLAAGTHRVRVTRAGRLPFVATVALSAPQVVDVTLRPDVGLLADQVRTAAAAGRDPDDALAAFDRIVWAGVRTRPDGGREIAGALFRSDSPRQRATVTVAGAGAAALERASRALLAALTAPALDPNRRAGRPGRPSQPPPAPAWYERPWIWIAAGAVVVAGGVGIAVAASQPSDQFVARLRTP